MDIRFYMSQVPEMDRFLTVDELHADLDRLAEQFPDVARLRRVGTSRLGEPLRMLSIGTGPHNAFLFGCPHQPMESISAEYKPTLSSVTYGTISSAVRSLVAPMTFAST